MSSRFLAALALAVAASSCFSSDTRECDGDIVCPSGLVCTHDGTSCRSPDSLCGDGNVDPGEACDDGNILAGDGCSANCRSTEICGNGIIDTDLPFNRTDHPERCLTATMQDTGCAEQCDLGTDENGVNLNVPGSGCSPNCLSDESCGNDILDDHLPMAAPEPPDPPHVCLSGTATGTGCAEVCDDGGNQGGDECSPNCLSLEACGNGIIDPGEACDDGDTDDTSGCRNDCMSSAMCGDGVIGPGEECDDAGESVRCDGAAAEPPPERCSARVCGDGYVNRVAGMTAEGVPVPAEQCDPDVVGGDSADCDRDCTLPVCGDGITNQQAGEQCDDGPNPQDGDGCSAMCQLEPYSLAVVRLGGGSGTVRSMPAGIDCGADCFQPYALNAMVRLTATPQPRSTFDTSLGTSGWSGCDTVTLAGECLVTMMTARAVTATFERNLLTVVRDGTGTGTITATGIDCGADCEEDYEVGATVTLMAMPTAATSELAGWSEPTCLDTSPTCTVTMNRARSVTATFQLRTFPLTVTFPATGDGKVTLTDGSSAIECFTDCTINYPAGEEVTIFAEAASNSDFTGWSGAGCTGTANCPITMTGAQSVAASFTLKTFTLGVARTGAGSGAVRSVVQPGIDCGADCSRIYDIGTQVELRAEPVAGSRFVRWTGDCSGTDPEVCTVTMAVNRAVTAEFRPIFSLTVTRNGDGVVRSQPPGIDCGATCSATFDGGTPVTLTADPDPGWRFASWSGCESTSGEVCEVTMSAARAVTATFVRTHVLTVTRSGAGAGTVTSNDGGISCGTGAGCTETYDVGTMVQLTAAEQAGSRFMGWTGCPSASGATCDVTMDAAHTIDAAFAPEYTLTVVRAGSGSGTVTSDVAHPGITCGGDCTEAYLAGDAVVLTATEPSGSRFVGWSGACVVGGDPRQCTVTMDMARLVTAEFRATFVLTVNKTGNGTVTADQGALACGATCSATYDTGTDVELSATADAGWRFTGWSGVSGCAGTGPCTVTMSQARTVTATFVPVHLVTVSKSGSGTGTVTADPAGNPPGITAANCGGLITTCMATFDEGTDIVLTAQPVTGSRVSGWSGCTSNTTNTCTINDIAALTSVTVQFTASYRLTVQRTGTGGGVVTGTGINCGSNCDETFDSGDSVTLTATAGFEDAFTGWSGDGGCAPDPTPPFQCTVIMTGPLTVIATFDDNILSVETSGTGSGTVTSSSHSNTNPINCSSSGSGNCDESYQQGTTVTLTATPPAGSRFVSWTGCTPVAGMPERCEVAMNGPVTVTAEFARVHVLTVDITGAGTVASTPPGIACAGDCTESYDAGTAVTLTATPPAGESVTWTNCTPDAGDPLICTLTMNAATTVTATFM